jgi:hypothetical protein
LSFQVHLIGESFHIQFGLGNRRDMKGTLPHRGSELLGRNTSGTEKKWAKHISNDGAL